MLLQKLKRVCQDKSPLLIIAEDARLADSVGAAGLHLPEWAVTRPQPGHRRWCRLTKFLTAAVHSSQALQKAQKMNVDAVLASPVSDVEPPDRAATGVSGFCPTESICIGAGNRAWRGHRGHLPQVDWYILRRPCGYRQS